MPTQLQNLDDHVEALRAIGRQFFSRGWSVGTSSNYSVVIQRDPLQLLVTASGKDKGALTESDFVRVGSDGQPVEADQPAASAETMLHVVAAEQGAQAVLHTHSIWATLLSDLFFPAGCLEITGYEMLKGLAGVKTHQHTERLPIFENTQDIPTLADQVRQQLANPAPGTAWHGYLIRRHGMYTWGSSLDEARRHVEVLEFLLECTARRLMLDPNSPTTATL